MYGSLARILAMTGAELRLFAFVSVLFVYAVFGSPTPDYPGAVELIIAIGLVLAVGVLGSYQALRFERSMPLWQSVGQMLLLFGLVVPTAKGVISGHDFGLVIRDVFPFLFMMLPVFLVGLLRTHSATFSSVLCSVLVLGVCFSFRAVADQMAQVSSLFSFAAGQDELTYFANAPSVLFTVLFLLGFAAMRLGGVLTLRDIVVAVLCFALATMVAFPLVLTAQRASLGYVVVYVVTLFLIGLWRCPQRTVVIAVISALFLLPFYSDIADGFEMMMEKTSLVGFNMRFEELAAVWHAISATVFDALFGLGWGGGFESPAVGEVRVHFTHSLLSSALLKMGVVGLTLTGLYILALAHILWRYVVSRPALILALAGPLTIDVFLYASFKSLDFGLLLLLIVGVEFSHRNSSQNHA